MIAHLIGEPLLDLRAPGRVFMRTSGGISYEVVISAVFGPADKEVITRDGLWIWHVISEDSQTLYGFLSLRERELAMQIREVQGMGPVSSARLVQDGGYGAVLGAIASGSLSGLSKLSKGLGPTRAQAIITKMQDYARTQFEVPGENAAGTFLARLQNMLAAARSLGLPVVAERMREILTQNEKLDDSSVFQKYTDSL